MYTPIFLQVVDNYRDPELEELADRHDLRESLDLLNSASRQEIRILHEYLVSLEKEYQENSSDRADRRQTDPFSSDDESSEAEDQYPSGCPSFSDLFSSDSDSSDDEDYIPRYHRYNHPNDRLNSNSDDDDDGYFHSDVDEDELACPALWKKYKELYWDDSLSIEQ